MDTIIQYPLTFGWYTSGVKTQDGTDGKDSDLKVLDMACERYDIPSIVEVVIASPKKSFARIVGYGYGVDYDPNRYVHIDMCVIHKNEIVRTTCCDSSYQRANLGEVSEALEVGEKLEGFDGLEILNQPKDIQLKYVTQDARLVVEIVKWENYRVLNVMYMISQLTKLDFAVTCHSAASKWWAAIIENAANEYLPYPVEKIPYAGGEVLPVKVGSYTKTLTYVLDVASQYPTMMILFNICPTTVCCSCCRNDAAAKVPMVVMTNINRWAADEKNNPPNCRVHYWICRKKTGLIPKILAQYREWRFNLLKQIKDNELSENTIEYVTQFTIKILMNSCYGVFGHEYFDYSNYKVAELTTAFARITLGKMKRIAQEDYRFNVVGGDTDSIFVADVSERKEIDKFLNTCKVEIPDVLIECPEKKIFRKFYLFGKKHYIAVPVNPKYKVELKGVEGKKSDRPKWIRNLQKQFGKDIAFDDIDHSVIFRQTYQNFLNEILPTKKELVISKTVRKIPTTYKHNIAMKRLGIEQEAEVGDAIRYCYGPDGKEHTNPEIIARAKYLEDLESTFKDQLEYAGYNYDRDVKGVISLSSLPVVEASN